MNRNLPDIPRLVAAASGAEDLLRRAAAALDRLVPVDGWCGLTLDPATLIKTGGVHESGLPDELFPRLLDIEYGERDVNLFADLARQPSPVAVLHEATEGRPESSPRFRDVMAPSGYGQELRLVLRERGRVWGAFTLLRRGSARPFSRPERRVLAELSSPLAEALRRVVVRGGGHRAGPGDPGAVESGLVLLDRGHRVSAITRDARRLLGEPDTDRLPVPVHAVAARARRSAGTVRARTFSPGGGWVTMSGARLDGSAQVAVSVETTRPEHLTALMLDAYGLSAREQEVTRLVLAGSSTSEIASTLFLSPYTVQDHVRAVFRKTGVRSRRALAGALARG